MAAANNFSLRGDRAGIVEIARRLGISPSTVSRALRPETAHLVQEERRRQIRDVADELHFTPNFGARMMRSGRSNVLTVVIPHDENVFFSEYYGRFLSGILHAAAERAWDVRISALRRVPGQDLLASLREIGLGSAGILYLGEPLTREELSGLDGYRRSLVLAKSALPADVDLGEIALPVVGVDNVAGARSAVALLQQLGHRRIGLILGPPASRDAYERRQGYLEALQAGGAEVPPPWMFEGPFSHETGRAGFAALFAGDRRPTALCCASDEIAFGVIDAARAAGLRCPADLSVIGFDDGPWAQACRPTLTTVRQPLGDLAERAVALLIEASSGRERRARRQRQGAMSAALVIRESTRAVAARR